jgi:type IV fimbrial biogenesis protein FimT
MRRGSAGFSLLELMAVIAIMAILAAIAIPGFGQLSASTKVKGASTELYLAMIRARSESVKRNRAVAVVAKSGAANDWQSGWDVIADGDSDGAYDPDDADDTVVADQGALQRVTITMAANTVVFRPTGRISGAAPAFDIASADPEYNNILRCVSADLTGRPYIRQEAC